jgi:hypothetical protein
MRNAKKSKRPMSDAICLNVWKLRRDKALTGDVATYVCGDITFRIRRAGLTLHVEYGETKIDVALSSKAMSVKHIPVEFVMMYCPECGRGCNSLYLLDGLIKCKACHGLFLDTLTRIKVLEDRLTEYQAFIDLRAEQARLGKRSTSYMAKDGVAYLGIAKRKAALLDRQIAAERLKLLNEAPQS